MRRMFLFVLLAGNACVGLAQTFHVAPDGLDEAGRGSQALPWATIEFALGQVPDGALVLVAPGLYEGRIRVRGSFDPPVTVRSAEPYRARLRHTATVLTIYSDSVDVAGIAIEGFDIAHSGPGAEPLVVQIQSLAPRLTRDITLRDNILHDSYNNDILKINNGARGIRVIGNLFYNQSGSDEHIDINSVEDVLVEGNVFFNDFAASGRSNGNDTSSYVVVKDSNAGDDAYLGAENVRIRRNVLLNWQGSPGSNYLLCGEDGTANHEAFDVSFENNLLLGNAANPMRAAFGVKGCRDVSIRANTVVGDLPSSAYAFRLNREGANPPLERIRFHNNIWSDGGGSMGRFSTTPPADTASFEFQRNLVFNGEQPLPSNGADLINPESDAEPVRGDPRLPDPATVLAPAWIPQQGVFAGGQARIAEVHRDLAERFGRPAADGAGVGVADAARMPADDLLGHPRGPTPSLGALEPRDLTRIFGNGFEAVAGSD